MTDPSAPRHPSEQSPFMKACRGEEVPFTPIWLMRQAGRYMSEYRELRARKTFLELCKSPALVSEVTVHAVNRIRADAAILFADLLLPVEPMGLELAFNKGEGPSIKPPVRDGAAVDRLHDIEPESLNYVYEAVKQTRRDLADELPLIGFAGAPFTIASYLVEGGPSRHFQHTKELMYRDPGAWSALMAKVVQAQTGFLKGQIDAGVQAVQIFDSWVGCLSPEDYRRYVAPHSGALIAGLPAGVPVIHFGTGTGTFLKELRGAGGSVIGVDWRVDLDHAWETIGHDVGIMGNLDPVVLFGDESFLRSETKRILDQAGRRPGHIFNLGHGILPTTPVDNVCRLIDLVHELSAR
jgi:uroporphyrinogen decarboxylase